MTPSSLPTTLKTLIEITVNAEADHHLGVNIKRLEDGALQLTQSKLLNSIFEECKDAIDGLSTRHTVPLRPNKPPTDDTPYDRKDYLHLLGRSRPDIGTALSFAATKSVSPTRHDYDNLLDIVRYLWQTRHIGLKIRPGNTNEPLRLKCYVDASFLSHEDSRGHSGYCLAIGELSSFYSKSKHYTNSQSISYSSLTSVMKFSDRYPYLRLS